MHGFLNINKEKGPTSYDVIRALKRLFPRKTRLGHTGTLDPMAAGVLPVAVGNATRLISFINDNEKVYRAEMTLGGVSDTEDAWGNITLTGKTGIKVEDIYNVLGDFTGVIKQVPPMYSALHHGGKRLYELAREGIIVERKAREVRINSLELLDITNQGLPVITLKVSCSSGTYIRSLCRDIGERLGTGAYLSGLLRLKTGRFSLEDSCRMDKLLDSEGDIGKYLLPVDFPLRDIPSYYLNNLYEDRLVGNGNPVLIDKKWPCGRVRLYSSAGQFLAIAEIVENGSRIYAQPKRVLK